MCWRQSLYHRALRSWVNDLNYEVLQPKGMYAKFQTNGVHSRYYNEEISWLAVAMTEEEAETLRNESVHWSPACCAPKIVPSPCACCCCCCFVRRVV